MSRIFGITIGVLWLGLALWAIRNSAAGWNGGHSDLGFWWGVIGVLLGLAAMVALVGTVRHRYQGPRK